MRVFDEDEKQIIGKIIHDTGYARNLVNLIDSRRFLEGVCIEINKTKRTANFLFQIENQAPTDEECQWGINKQTELTELIIKYLALFNYLEKRDLAVFFEPAKSNDIISFGMGAVNLPSFAMSINDQSVIDLLIKYVNKEIMPSPELKVLENNKFISEDDRRFKKQLVAAWSAIVISILIGLYGVLTNIKNSNTQELQFKAQVQENKKIANMIINKLDEVQAHNIDYRPILNEVTSELKKRSTSAKTGP